MRKRLRPSDQRPGSARWFLGDAYTLFFGPSYDLPDHHGGAPVLLAGLYGKFRIRVGAMEWRWCRMAAVPPGLVHALDFGGDPIAALYIEPNIGSAETFSPLIGCAREANGAIVGTSGEVTFLQSLFEATAYDRRVHDGITDLIQFARTREQRAGIDPRVEHVVRHMLHPGDLTSVEEIARQVDLSSSRFQHLFSQQTGVAYRRYRAWIRMRAAIREIAVGKSLTLAAHAAGYADLAHFSRDCRRTFGSTFSRSRKSINTGTAKLR